MVDQTFLWSVNKLARAVTKWTQTCARRLARLISYIHHINDFQQYCHVSNTAQHCRLGLFQDSDFAGDLEDSNQPRESYVSSEAEHLFFLVGCASSKHQYPYSSTESEIISFDAELRMDGSPALDLWDIVIEVLRSTSNTTKHGRPAKGNLCGTGDHVTFIKEYRTTNPWSSRKLLAKSIWCHTDEGQGSQTGTRKLVRTTQSPEVEYSQVRRQERAQHSNPWKQDNGEESSHFTRTGKLVQTRKRTSRIFK